MEPADKNQQEHNPITIALKWKTLDNLPTLYANQLFITHATGEFYLFFGEASPPLVLNPAEMPPYIEVFPKAKIVVAPEMMSRISELIRRNLDNFNTKNKLPSNSDDLKNKDDEKL